MSLPEADAEQRIKGLIDRIAASEVTRLEQDVFSQRKRLADAERKLVTKVTKAATESKRIAVDKIERGLGRLADLRRTAPRGRDARIYPGYYGPLIVMEAGRLLVKPMRDPCRLGGKPAFYDTKLPGTYNARRDHQRPLQGRTDPSPRPLEDQGRCRTGNPRMGRLV